MNPFTILLSVSLILCVLSSEPSSRSDDSAVWAAIDAWQLLLQLDTNTSGALPPGCAYRGTDTASSLHCNITQLPLDRPSERSALYAVSVLWPSGIVVQEEGQPPQVLRRAALQYSIVSVRSEWSVVYTVPLFTKDECDRFIAAAEVKGRSLGGWGRSHNPTDPLPSVDLSTAVVLGTEAAAELHQYLENSVLRAMADSFGLDHRLLRLRDVHIAKYNASSGEKRNHPPHQDKSLFSFVIALNSPRKRGHKIAGSFDGGGTRFTYIQQHVNPAAGTAVYFHGKVEHEGVEITRGVRYIMVGFCDYGNANEWGKRYDPSYDGSAFAAGVRNGDTIRGIQTCTGNLNSIVPEISKVFPNTSTSEWLSMAQSCERVRDGTIFVLEREFP